MQAKLEHATLIRAQGPDTTNAAMEAKLTNAAAQQAQHDGLIIASIIKPAVKLARHNSSPLPK